MFRVCYPSITYSACGNMHICLADQMHVEVCNSCSACGSMCTDLLNLAQVQNGLEFIGNVQEGAKPAVALQYRFARLSACKDCRCE